MVALTLTLFLYGARFLAGDYPTPAIALPLIWWAIERL